jgi:hypothetical protein
MEEIEIGTEQQQEDIKHHAEESNEKWLLHCALLSAVLAVAAAVTGLYSAGFANEAMIEQMHASDHWGYYQAKGIKAQLTEMHSDLLESQGKQAPEALKQKLDVYHKEQQEIKDQATEEESKSSVFLQKHESLAKAVTAYQIAIAVTAMAAICRRKQFLIFTLLLSIIGTYFMVAAFWL